MLPELTLILATSGRGQNRRLKVNGVRVHSSTPQSDVDDMANCPDGSGLLDNTSRELISTLHPITKVLLPGN